MEHERDYLDEIIEESRKDPVYRAMDDALKSIRGLAAVRVSLGLTEADVAKRMRVDKRRVVRIEQDPSDVSFIMIALYAAALGATLEPKLP